MEVTLNKKKKGSFINYHRFEARCYDNTSGFQTVWQPLIEGNNKKRSKMITTRHIYFLSRILQDSLLTRRFNQAIAAMIGLSGKCEKVIELFCLAGLEILKNIPHSHMLCLKFYKNMFLACADHQQEVVLNFALYLVLRKRDVVEGLELLKSKSDKLKFNQSLMHKAYIALFEYILHQPKSAESSGFHGEDISDSEDDEIFQQTLPTKTNLDFSLKRSMVLFEEVFSAPGVWDTFVPAYVELLTSNEGVTAVRKFLEDYRDKNPLNPNTHRYLYRFLKSNSGSEQELMRVLEDLVKIDTTSEYLEDLVELKTKSGVSANIVRMLFEKLDHSACLFDEKTWKQLDSHLNTGCVKMEPGLKQEIVLCWKDRKSWWPRYHFRLARNFKFSNELRTVMLCKARLAEHFLGSGNDFSKAVHGKYGPVNNDKRKEKTVQELTPKRAPKRHACDQSNTENGQAKRVK